MTRMVNCARLKKELPGLEAAPFPGPRGQEIFETVSQQAWQEWQTLQTMLINEKHLNMMDPESRTYLQGELEKFISGDDYDQAEGYVPPSA